MRASFLSMFLYAPRIAYLTPSSPWGLGRRCPEESSTLTFPCINRPTAKSMSLAVGRLALAGYIKRLHYMRLQPIEKHPLDRMAGQEQEESQHFPNPKVCGDSSFVSALLTARTSIPNIFPTGPPTINIRCPNHSSITNMPKTLIQLCLILPRALSSSI